MGARAESLPEAENIAVAAPEHPLMSGNCIEANMNIVWTYLIYLALSIGITVGVARTLHKNGRVFLVDAFHGNELLADSVNHLLVVGFYLINLGYVTLRLKYGVKPTDLAESIEFLSSKIGLVLLVLGIMHFLNLHIFSRIRRRAKRDLELIQGGRSTTRRTARPKKLGNA
jgi:hypothetical protein